MLHISLGVFYRLFSLLEQECHQLDLQHALLNSSASTVPSYSVFAKALKQVHHLREEAKKLQGEAAMFDQLISYLTLQFSEDVVSQPIQVLHSQVSVCRKKIRELVCT